MKKIDPRIRLGLIFYVPFIIIGSFFLYLTHKASIDAEFPLLNFLSSWPFLSILVSLTLFIYIYAEIMRVRNIRLLIKLINSNAEYSLFNHFFLLFLKKRIEGIYKGRKIVLRIYAYAERSPKLISIIPYHMPLVKTGLRPTANTYITGQEIRYFPGYFAISKIDFFKKFNQQDFIDIFDELTRAAEIVETQPVETFIKTTDEHR
ncbi:MAG: hypothetical protein AB1629_06800 [Candidatus Omnitrophota bacterium]